jgi:hypothetical protein
MEYSARLRHAKFQNLWAMAHTLQRWVACKANLGTCIPHSGYLLNRTTNVIFPNMMSLHAWLIRIILWTFPLDKILLLHHILSEGPYAPSFISIVSLEKHTNLKKGLDRTGKVYKPWHLSDFLVIEAQIFTGNNRC